VHDPSLPRASTAGKLAIGSGGKWQVEPWEHAVFEAGHRADPIAGEREDVEADAMADAGTGRR